MTLDAARGLLACPHCAQPLTQEGASLCCPAHHTFDVAKQGYVNLLAGPQPKNADTPAMVDARARFLASGAYDRIADDVARRVRHSGVIAEIGAGTGFYLSHALEQSPDARGLALDVSVAAAKRAAKAHPRMASVVADAWETLPLRPSRLGAVASIFAPRNMAEFARILADGGLLVVVTPNQGHLASLRDQLGLLTIEPDKDARLRRSALGLFETIASNRLAYTLDAPGAVIHDLVAMGPNAFHGVPDAPDDARIDVDVTVWLFRKLSPQG